MALIRFIIITVLTVLNHLAISQTFIKLLKDKSLSEASIARTLHFGPINESSILLTQQISQITINPSLPSQSQPPPPSPHPFQPQTTPYTHLCLARGPCYPIQTHLAPNQFGPTQTHTFSHRELFDYLTNILLKIFSNKFIKIDLIFDSFATDPSGPTQNEIHTCDPSGTPPTQTQTYDPSGPSHTQLTPVPFDATQTQKLLKFLQIKNKVIYFLMVNHLKFNIYLLLLVGPLFAASYSSFLGDGEESYYLRGIMSFGYFYMHELAVLQ